MSPFVSTQSATAMADERGNRISPAEASRIDLDAEPAQLGQVRTALLDLFELFPHMESRFYRSLAVSLSRRLRDQIGIKPVASSAT